jgi:hypothetical protein
MLDGSSGNSDQRARDKVVLVGAQAKLVSRDGGEGGPEPFVGAGPLGIVDFRRTRVWPVGTVQVSVSTPRIRVL